MSSLMLLSVGVVESNELPISIFILRSCAYFKNVGSSSLVENKKFLPDLPARPVLPVLCTKLSTALQPR